MSGTDNFGQLISAFHRSGMLNQNRIDILETVDIIIEIGNSCRIRPDPGYGRHLAVFKIENRFDGQHGAEKTLRFTDTPALGQVFEGIEIDQEMRPF